MAADLICFEPFIGFIELMGAQTAPTRARDTGVGIHDDRIEANQFSLHHRYQSQQGGGGVTARVGDQFGLFNLCPVKFWKTIDHLFEERGIMMPDTGTNPGKSFCVFQPIIGTQIDHPLAFLYELSHGSLGHLMRKGDTAQISTLGDLNGREGLIAQKGKRVVVREKIRDLFATGLFGGHGTRS